MFLFLSAELENNSNNEANTALLYSHLKRAGLKFDEVLGCYEGSTEVSFRVEYYEKDFSLLSYFAFGLFNQDSVMIVDNNNVAQLHYGNGHCTIIGKLSEVSEVEARKQDAWSLIGGKYFIVK